MYRSSSAEVIAAGHESAGVTSPAMQWFLAEGATRPFSDLFILLANPTAKPAEVVVEYLLSTGGGYAKTYTVAPFGRFIIPVDAEE